MYSEFEVLILVIMITKMTLTTIMTMVLLSVTMKLVVVLMLSVVLTVSVMWMSMALLVMVTASVMTMIMVILVVSVSCNGDRGGVGGGRANKGDDKDRNGAHRSENREGNGIAVELNSDHELVATEDYSLETVLVSNTFPLSVHPIIKERSGTQRQSRSFAMPNCFPRIVNINVKSSL